MYRKIGWLSSFNYVHASSRNFRSRTPNLWSRGASARPHFCIPALTYYSKTGFQELGNLSALFTFIERMALACNRTILKILQQSMLMRSATN